MVRFEAVGAASLAVAVLAGSMTAQPSLPTTFVYVGNADSSDISVLQLNRRTASWR